MEPAEIAGLRTMYAFGPADDETWGLTFEGFTEALRERGPDEFAQLMDETTNPPPRRGR